MDAIGGPSKGYGAPEIATCGRDGAVRVWDVRQRDAPVAAFEPAEGQQVRVYFGGGGSVIFHPSLISQPM